MSRRKTIITCIAQYQEGDVTNLVFKSIYSVTPISGAPLFIEVQCWRSGGIQAKIINAEDLKAVPYKKEISLVHQLLRENKDHGATQISDVSENPFLGIEIVTQGMVMDLAKKSLGSDTLFNDGDCDCSDGD